ncbi:hypothetical protein BDK51DRAFT_37512 [Blyttiomyces helicus]|uniref:Uncharacterized protein n=1 Tax=Blyttiomyces helicus TaxID=388810 RepID=A0A4P9WDL0_9FUNG|nr:hypothetical protein BDK51DRAFT_37512 [Blyttiomyces helicus]|eukprot:RKO89318.1 hypothetical protein BDK51DRAFT_37512 [Blyttiomyces helicus]
MKQRRDAVASASAHSLYETSGGLAERWGLPAAPDDSKADGFANVRGGRGFNSISTPLQHADTLGFLAKGVLQRQTSGTDAPRPSKHRNIDPSTPDSLHCLGKAFDARAITRRQSFLPVATLQYRVRRLESVATKKSQENARSREARETPRCGVACWILNESALVTHVASWCNFSRARDADWGETLGSGGKHTFH